MDLAQFKNTFCETVKITKKLGNRTTVDEFITDYHNIDYLHSLIDPYVFRYDLRLSIGKQYSSVVYDLADDEREKYNELKGWFLDPQRLAMLNNNIFIRMVQKMQHSYCCSSGKMDEIGAILKGRNPEDCLIFCKFINSRLAMESAFPDVKVLTYGKHALGLNLQQFSTIIFADKTFDYAQRVQAEHRIFRQGQSRDCQYIDLTGRVGLEDLIDKNIKKKVSLLEYFKEKGIETIKEL